jgi:hypothetical protein
MRISGSGIARTGQNAIKKRRELYMASAAISCLHDALLAVAQGKITVEQVRDFFWHAEDIAKVPLFGDVLDLEKKPDAT